MQLTNTLTRQKETFKPLKQDKVKVYYCGPTPYNYAHIGNLRTYIFEDIVIRTLRFLGYRVETTMNITDIDDKTIRDSQKNNEDLKVFTQKYSKYFFEDIEKLGINKADNIAPISDLIPEMIEIINWLLEKWYAYLAPDGSIYFSISKFRKYWELAHLDKSGMKTSVRIDNDEYEKEEMADFVLWKAYSKEKDGPNKWEGKFKIITNNELLITNNKDWKNSKNLQTKNYELKTIWWRPGWHIECSACNMKYFGPQIDLHMWAIDNIFPHHQNEIAQTEAYTGKTFSKYWLHTGHLLVDNQKMSKSKWNFYTLRDIEEKMKDELTPKQIYRSYRLMNLQAKYSDSFNFSFDKLRQAAITLKNFDEVLKRIKNYPAKSGKVSREFANNMQYFIQDYISKIEDDFDTSNALVVVFETIKYINWWIDSNIFSDKEILSTIDLLKTYNEILNIFDFSILEITEEIPYEINKLLIDRQEAKNQKNYQLADNIRDIIISKWYKIIDDKNWSRAEKI